MKNLTTIPRPFLVSVICEQERSTIAQAIEGSVSGGADAIEMNLSQIAEHDLEEIGRMISAAPVPVYTACRRRDFMAVYGHRVSELAYLDDQQRMERQLQLTGSAVAIDMEFDTFADGAAGVLPGFPPNAKECVRSESVLVRQRELIEYIHSKGLEVVISSHTSVPLAEGQIVALAQAMRRQGADLIKIINKHTEAGYCSEIFRATLALRAKLGCPFVLLSMGPGSMIFRRMACHFGCTYTFCRVPNLKYFYDGHPGLDELHRLFNNFPPQASLAEIDGLNTSMEGLN